jgi:Trp operon repressor
MKNKGEILYKALMKASSPKEIEMLLSILLGKQEVKRMIQRAKIVEALLERIKYREIIRITGASSATVAKMSKDIDGVKLDKFFLRRA